VDDGDVVVERRIAARPESLFKFFSDSRRYVRGDGFVSGEFIEIIPNKKGGFHVGMGTAEQSRAAGTSIVGIELIDVANVPLLRLTNRGLPGSGREIYRVGWENYTARLAAVGEARDPGPDPLRARPEKK